MIAPGLMPTLVGLALATPVLAHQVLARRRELAVRA
jgi:hypothetical protein